MKIDTLIHWCGGLLAFSVLGVLLYGIWLGIRRQAGRTTGLTGAWLHSPWFYLITAALFFGACYFGWVPLPKMVSTQIRAWMLVLGSFLYFPGLLFVLWSRYALGSNYFPSTGFGVQLFANHQLITSGPYAIVRHPMYVGLILGAFGSMLIYFTWTTLCFACIAPFFTVRARREEAALAEEFGDLWQAYCNRVPAFIPRLKHRVTKIMFVG